MALAQFVNSLMRIARNRHIHRGRAAARHLAWQLRKLAGRFPVELRLSNSALIAAHGRCGVSALVNTHGMYDYNNMTLIQLVLSGGGLFVDVGANIGAYTLIASEQDAAQVLAFEPHPITFAALRSNIARNRRGNVTAVCAAVGDEAGMIAITNTPGSSTTHITSVEGSDSISVPVVRLDAELRARRLKPYIVKIDVEGYELDVLKGLGTALADAVLVFVEINGLSQIRATGAEPICATLSAAGFVGPLYYDAASRELIEIPVAAGEDPIFVARTFLNNLTEKLGIRVTVLSR
jgi:FkbM family methyltransferase